MNEDSFIIVKELGKTYVTASEKLDILTGVNLQIRKGETVIITGESGSGKSTLLNLLGGLDFVTTGTISINGVEISSLSENALTPYRSKVIGYIYQFHYLLKDFTALENVMLPAFIAGERKSAALARAAELISRVGLKERGGHFPSQLSGGERQRVAVARALINDPAVILADEPTGNLDERNSENVEEILFDLVADYQKTLILVTHDLSLSSRGDRHMQLEKGLLV